jgi:cis-3-alkyl-4-acyloxetan-2-one decarboxylase
MAFDISAEIYPYTGQYFVREGLKLHYLDEGEGEAVVMVHGNPSWSIYYRNLVTSLKDTHRCIVPDHMGCGLSDKPNDDEYTYTLENRVDDLDVLLDSLEIRDNITLVLHDWGGMIGMAFATRHPDRIKRIVVLNTSAFHLPKTEKLPLGIWICRNTFLGTLLVRGFNAFSAGAASVGCKRNPMSRELQKAYRAPYNSWKNRIATVRFVQDIPLNPGDPGYEIVQAVQDNVKQFSDTPILICWGMKDFVFEPYFLKLWEENLLHAEVHRYDDCGHYILEDAQDEVVPLITDFIQQR